VAGVCYYLAVTGKLTADTGCGRRVRRLGPFSIDFGAAGKWGASEMAAAWEAAVHASFAGAVAPGKT
jgi:hypothetical protein